MPIYEFHCNDCGSDNEVLVRTTDWAGTQCPKCSSTQLTKKLSVFAAANVDGGDDEAPPCSGDPGSCGRCAID